MEDRLRKLIVLIGDEGFKYEVRDAKKVSEVLDDTFSNKDSDYLQIVTGFLIKAISSIPNKQHIYALVTALLANKHSKMAESLITGCFQELQQLMCQCRLHPAKNILVYLAELMNINLMNSSIFLGVLEDIIHEVDKASTSLRVYYLELLVKILPFCWKGLQTKLSSEFKKLLDRIRKAVEALQLNTEFVDFWNLFLGLHSSGKLKDQSKVSLLAAAAQLEKLPQFIPQLKLKLLDKSAHYQFSRLPLIRIQEEDELYKQFNRSIQAYVHRQNISNIVFAFRKTRKLLVDKLVLYVVNSQNSFLSKFLIESLFKEALAQNIQDTIVYSSLLVHLSNQNDETFRKDIRRTVEETALAIFYKLENYDLDFMEKLAEIVSFYIANYVQVWEWSKWVDGEDKFVKRAAFLRLVFEKAAALSESAFSKDNTKQVSRYISTEKINVIERTSKDEQAYKQLLTQKLSLKCQADKLIEQIGNANEFEIFQETLMTRMSNSITHLNILSQRYRKVFTHFSAMSEKYQRTVISKVNQFWTYSQYHKIQYYTLFIKKDMIRIEAFLEWVSMHAKVSDDMDKILLCRVYQHVMNTVGSGFENKELINELEQSLAL